MEERIKISIYWLIGAVFALIAPYKYGLYIMILTGDHVKNQPKLLTWFMGAIMLAVTIAAVCLAAYGFYRWMHWLLNGDNTNDKSR